MSIYTVREVNGKLRYWKDRQFVKIEDIPANIYVQLEVGKPVSDEGIKLEGGTKLCVFCGVPCKLTRFVELQTVYLCEDHFYSETIGKIVARLRSKNGKGNEQTKEINEEAKDVQDIEKNDEELLEETVNE